VKREKRRVKSEERRVKNSIVYKGYTEAYIRAILKPI